MISNISTKTGNLIDKGINRQIYLKEIAVMFKIVRFPKKLESFFDSLKNQFHWNHFEYFRTLVLLITISWGRRNISALYRHLDSQGQPHRSRFNNFLNVGRCNPEIVLQMKAAELLCNLSPREGEVVKLIIDDSKKQKRGKLMDAVNWIRDPLSGRSIRGQSWPAPILWSSCYESTSQ